MATARRLRDQRGQSLIEVSVAIILISAALLSLIGALFTSIRATEVNEDVSIVNAAIVGYGEVLRTDVAYRDCVGSPAIASYYTSQAATKLSTYDPTSPSTTIDATRWRKPDTMAVQVTDVDSWSPGTQSFADGCADPDTGAQKLTISVSFNGEEKTAEVIKRWTKP